jgi:hypothetical protein
MNSNKPVKILPKNWARIPPAISQGELIPEFLCPHIHQGIPMDKHLEELIRIPEGNTNDYLHNYRARFLPQKYNYQNQNLLRRYSNEIVEGLRTRRVNGEHHRPLDQYLSDFCNRHDHGYCYFEYCRLTMDYFLFLLPQMPLFSRGKVSFLADMKSIPDGERISENTLINGKNHQKYRNQMDSMGRVLGRFSFLPEMQKEIEMVTLMIEQAGESQKLKDLCIDNDLAHCRRLKPRKARKSLMQCIFCYRFFEGVGRVPRTCSSNECQKADKAWTKLLESKGLSPHDFYFFNRSSTSKS